MTTLRQALEEAIFADPDDRAAHMAYADYLTEDGDPHGELISVQLSLEDPSLPSGGRQELQQRERHLFAAHGRGWLGELAPYLLDQKGAPSWATSGEHRVSFHFRRGWLVALEVPYLSADFARCLRTAPAARSL